MKIAGITGGIGSGKSTVCRIFELLGVPVFYADDEAKKLYDDRRIRSKVAGLFGKKVLLKDGKVDKKKLAEIVFKNKKALHQLNALIHPAVRSCFLEWVKAQKGLSYVVKEAAIMIESGAYKDIDYLISVESTKSLRIKRIKANSKMTNQEISGRIKEQISDRERRKYADAVIINDENHSLISQVLKIHARLSGQ